MDAQSVRKTGGLANTGCALGVLSLGFIVAAFVSPFVASYDRHALEAVMAVGFMVIFIALGGWILGLAGLVVSLIALRRKMKEGGYPSKGIVVTGLVLNGLGVAIVCFLLAYIFLFNSPTPPPVMITPSLLIPLPPGG